MTRIARGAVCLTLAINFAAILYAGTVAHNPYSITVGVLGLLTTLGIAVVFYLDQKQIRTLQQHNELLQSYVSDPLTCERFWNNGSRTGITDQRDLR